MEKKQSASMEDYLEAIATLAEKDSVARVKQIGHMLDVKMPSVTSALKKLSEQGLVTHEKYEYVRLTTRGSMIAKNVVHRHETLHRFLSEILKVDPKIAEEDACRMEHAISPTSMERLTRFVEFALTRQQGAPAWLKDYNYCLKHEELPEERPVKGSKKGI